MAVVNIRRDVDDKFYRYRYVFRFLYFTPTMLTVSNTIKHACLDDQN